MTDIVSVSVLNYIQFLLSRFRKRMFGEKWHSFLSTGEICFLSTTELKEKQNINTNQ